MDNYAERFIKAYNKLDYTIKNLYNFKRGMPFSDCIRRAVPLNSVIRRFEDELVDYSRLRNAIIHSNKNDDDEIIAIPKKEVVEQLEHITNLICTPPTVYDTVCRKDVLCVENTVSVKETIALMAKSGYSNLPVYKNGEILGVANGQKIINTLGDFVNKGGDCSKFIDETMIEDIITVDNNFYTIKAKSLTISDALNLFYDNRKLLVILITPNGNYLEMPIGIVTVGDILDINKILENY